MLIVSCDFRQNCGTVDPKHHSSAEFIYPFWQFLIYWNTELSCVYVYMNRNWRLYLQECTTWFVYLHVFLKNNSAWGFKTWMSLPAFIFKKKKVFHTYEGTFMDCLKYAIVFKAENMTPGSVINTWLLTNCSSYLYLALDSCCEWPRAKVYTDLKIGP